uniref:Uncharacterized protein n=1 Tax=Emberiza spodocephala Genomoviridae sp. TaxID=2814950 RepID=A0A8A4XCQ1_9VIRU|nr:MAG: hypothetical protein [Emberiza spodocephala Genomoviridae sp.]
MESTCISGFSRFVSGGSTVRNINKNSSDNGGGLAMELDHGNSQPLDPTVCIPTVSTDLITGDIPMVNITPEDTTTPVGEDTVDYGPRRRYRKRGSHASVISRRGVPVYNSGHHFYHKIDTKLMARIYHNTETNSNTIYLAGSYGQPQWSDFDDSSWINLLAELQGKTYFRPTGFRLRLRYPGCKQQYLYRNSISSGSGQKFFTVPCGNPVTVRTRCRVCPGGTNTLEDASGAIIQNGEEMNSFFNVANNVSVLNNRMKNVITYRVPKYFKAAHGQLIKNEGAEKPTGSLMTWIGNFFPDIAITPSASVYFLVDGIEPMADGNSGFAVNMPSTAFYSGGSSDTLSTRFTQGNAGGLTRVVFGYVEYEFTMYMESWGTEYENVAPSTEGDKKPFVTYSF